jgi:hypothetical protein
MVKTKPKTVTLQETESIICDVCKREVPVKDFGEIQEFLHINELGGFESIFGDGTVIKCDICQECLKKLLGPYLRLYDL